MKNLLLILLSTFITSLQAQNFLELRGDLFLENSIYLDRQIDVIYTETSIVIDYLPQSYLLFKDDNTSFLIRKH